MSYTETNTIRKTFTGTGANIIEVSPQYTHNQISIEGVSTGTMVVRQMAKGVTVFSGISGGTITLSEYQTILVNDGSFQQFEVTVSAGGTYDIVIDQSNMTFGTV